MKLCLVTFVALLTLLACGATAWADSGRHVDVIRLSGDVDPIHASFLDRGLSQAASDGASAVIVELDTPGGDIGSLEDMVKHLDASPVPTIIYVYPEGAWAGSAGTVVTMAGDLAVMAPGTSIGAASPVGSNGQNLNSTEDRKVMNFMIAYITAQARDHHHNQAFAKRAVHVAAAIPYQVAVKDNAVNFAARDIGDLLARANEMQVQTPNGVVTFHTAGASIRYINMDMSENLQQILTDPNLLLILMSVGTLALIFELSSPGAILPGIVGVLCITIALFSLGTLTVNLAGLVLMAFGILLFIADIKMPTHGFLTVGGIISFVLGGLLLFSPTGTNGGPTLSPWILLLVTFMLAGFFGFIVHKAVQARHWTVKTGAQAMIGLSGVTRTRLDPEGSVLVDGEVWKAVTGSGSIEEGSEVVVTQLTGLTLHVVPIAATSTLSGSSAASYFGSEPA